MCTKISLSKLVLHAVRQLHVRGKTCHCFCENNAMTRGNSCYVLCPQQASYASFLTVCEAKELQNTYRCRKRNTPTQSNEY